MFGVLLILASILLASYPFLSNYLMGLNQDSEIGTYEEELESLGAEALAEELEAARAYNDTLMGRTILSDPFDPDAGEESDEEYESLLDISDNGVIARVEIPAIGVDLPVFHGTGEEALKKGAGHLRRTSLPVGGTGTHAVITGHTGLSSAKLFTDLNLMEVGDIFFIHCLGQTLAYQVDCIRVVEPTETEDLRIDPEQDYVTLVTCTPYGINTHRLLVRGSRIPLEDVREMIADEAREKESTWMREYKRAALAGGIVFALLLALYHAAGRGRRHGAHRRRRKR